MICYTGIWEEYCLICAGPLTNKFVIYNDEANEEKEITPKGYN